MGGTQRHCYIMLSMNVLGHILGRVWPAISQKSIENTGLGVFGQTQKQNAVSMRHPEKSDSQKQKAERLSQGLGRSWGSLMETEFWFGLVCKI